jgi:hypothetical protein
MHAKRALLVLAIAGLWSCDRSDESGSAAAPTAATSKRAQAPDPTADMVSAVSGGNTGAPVELKFALTERPQIGRPVEVEIAVLPIGNLDRIAASFRAGAGLELRQGEQMAAIDKPESGTPISHKVTVVPQRDGIFFVSAVVQADSPTESLTRTFSIPIIAGTGVPPVEGGSAAPDQPNSQTP